MGIDPVATARTLASAPVEAADTDRCAHLLDTSRQLRCWLDAFDASIANRHNELRSLAAATSQPLAPPVEDVLSKHCGVSAAEGRKRGRRSETISDAPSFGDALAAGTVIAEHIDALANVTEKLDDDVKAAFFEHEADLLDNATKTTPARFARGCRDLARSLERDAGIERNRQQRRNTFLSHRINPQTGMIEGRFAFHPELGNQIFNAVQQEVAALLAAGIDRSVDRQQLAAVALGNLVTGGHHATRALEADITVIVDVAALTTGELHAHSVCETTDGAGLPPASILRLLCSGSVTPVITGADGIPINVGRTRRQATRAQRRALRAIYRTCAFTGCGIDFGRCEIHHIVPWESGGWTDLANLLPLCSRHHHVVHDERWSLHLAPDRTLTISQPDGQIYSVEPPELCRRPHHTSDSPGRVPPDAGNPAPEAPHMDAHTDPLSTAPFVRHIA